MPSIGVHVECHDPKGLRQRHYQFHDRHLPSQKYVSLFKELQSRLEQDVSADTGAFEVVVVDPVDLGPLTKHFKAFSKIGTGKWPQVDALCNRLKQVLDAARSGDAQEVGRIVGRMQQISEGGAGAAGADSTRCAAPAPAPPWKPPLLSSRHSGRAALARRSARRPLARTPPAPPRPPAGAAFAGFPAPARPTTAGAARPSAAAAAAAPPRPRSAAEARAPPSRGPAPELLRPEALAGYWRSDNPKDSMLVECGRVTWASRPDVQAWLKAFGHDRVLLTGPFDTTHKGILQGTPKDGSLVWDDGDVWMRYGSHGTHPSPRANPDGLFAELLTEAEALARRPPAARPCRRTPRRRPTATATSRPRSPRRRCWPGRRPRPRRPRPKPATTRASTTTATSRTTPRHPPCRTSPARRSRRSRPPARSPSTTCLTSPTPSAGAPRRRRARGARRRPRPPPRGGGPARRPARWTARGPRWPARSSPLPSP